MKKMSEEQEKVMTHRTSIWEAEISRLNGECTYSMEQVRSMLEKSLSVRKRRTELFPTE